MLLYGVGALRGSDHSGQEGRREKRSSHERKKKLKCAS